MKQRVLYGILLTALALNLWAGVQVYHTNVTTATRDNPAANEELFNLVLEKVHHDYVDRTNVAYRDLVYGALKGMVNTLDPHSEFLDPEQYQQLQDDTEGTFGGLGVVIGLKDNHITVISPIEDSPGSRAGILSGDRIIKVNGQSTEKWTLEDTVKDLRGEPGSEVVLTTMRPATGEVRELKLTRAIITVDMVKDINGQKEFPVDANGIGYVRIVQFSEKTSDELEAALQKLQSRHVRALVLDLRWNPGGLLEQAVKVCEKFLPRGRLVVTTEGRNPSQNSTYRAAGRGDELVGPNGTPLPLVVLVNIGSASAAEIVTGCLHDWKRAIVLGETTFGKGSVQTIDRLPDGSALKLTMAKYYTPSHNVIHEHGITPDVYVPMTDAEERDVLLKRTVGGVESLTPQDRDRVLASHDVQLDRAEDMLKGLMLYTKLEKNSAGPEPAENKMASR
ncbi:MAG TPA: S41 family peptidase [Dongiaceae bacterium]|nr:S41 family peptidase [Dongiaceae bacterium]